MNVAAKSITVYVRVQLSTQQAADTNNHRAMLLNLLKCIR